jgi:ABC-type transport system involved in cytochrome c biogenesis permease subunit
MKKWFPMIATALMAVWFLSSLRAPKEKDFHFQEFGRLPLLFNGRLQPMDSLARNSLLQIREKQEANLEPWKAHTAHPKIIPAIEWLATVMMNPDVADTWQVFRIDNPQLQSLLKLPDKDQPKQDGKHYSWTQIQPSLDAMQEQTARISKREADKISDPSKRDAFEKAVMKLHERLVLYMRLKNTLQPQDARDWPKELAEYEASAPAGIAAVRAQQVGEKHDESLYEKFLNEVQRFDTMARFEPPLLVPTNERGNWTSGETVGEALLNVARGKRLPNAVRAYAAISGAFRKGDAAEFNKQVVSYRQSVSADYPRALVKADREHFFNRMQAFYKAMVIYVLAFLFACAFWFTLSNWVRRSAVWLVALALVIHTVGLLFRMWLEGRPPVTNLYSSAIFIGWGACILGLILEGFWKNAIGVVVSSAVGFITLIIAHHLSLGGDTMEMMRAVLDTNFWLATHVVVVTLGYASTFVAGFLAIVYLVMGIFTPNLTRRMSTRTDTVGKSLAKMVYGIVCFATLFSFVGTVLGGIWADQSWGRFWGWDPKENGALIIVLWNALVLHLRWGGIVRERGLVLCAIGGNIVTAWSWFGVNMLGIGLHSYGFTDAAFRWLMLFVVSQLALVALGLLPLKYWRSYHSETDCKTSPPSVPGSAKQAA